MIQSKTVPLRVTILPPALVCALLLLGLLTAPTPSRAQEPTGATAAAAAVAAVAGAEAPADAERAIQQLREGLVDSFNQGDMDRLLTYLETNAVVTWQNGEVCEGTAAVRAYYDRMMSGDQPIVSKVTANPEIRGRLIRGDWAVSWGVLNDRFLLTDGSDLAFNSRFTATIARRGDRWLVTAFHVSVNAFDNPVLSLAIGKVSLWAGMAGLAVGLLGAWVASRIFRRPKSCAPA